MPPGQLLPAAVVSDSLLVHGVTPNTAPEIDFEELRGTLEGAGGNLYQGSAFVTCFNPESDDTEQRQKYAGAD